MTAMFVPASGAGNTNISAEDAESVWDEGYNRLTTEQRVEIDQQMLNAEAKNKVSENEGSTKSYAFMMCLNGRFAYLFGTSIGICRSSDGSLYRVLSLSAGLQSGGAVQALFLTYYGSSPKNITGQYRGGESGGGIAVTANVAIAKQYDGILAPGISGNGIITLLSGGVGAEFIYGAYKDFVIQKIK